MPPKKEEKPVDMNSIPAQNSRRSTAGGTQKPPQLNRGAAVARGTPRTFANEAKNMPTTVKKENLSGSGPTK